MRVAVVLRHTLALVVIDLVSSAERIHDRLAVINGVAVVIIPNWLVACVAHAVAFLRLEVPVFTVTSTAGLSVR